MLDSIPISDLFQGLDSAAVPPAHAVAGVAGGGVSDGGLVSSFISRRSSDDSQGASFGVEVVPGGVIVKCLGCKGGNPEPEKCGKVKGFSRASRRRCMEMLMRLDWSNLSAQGKHADAVRAFFVTLTYWREISPWLGHALSQRVSPANGQPFGRCRGKNSGWTYRLSVTSI